MRWSRSNTTTIVKLGDKGWVWGGDKGWVWGGERQGVVLGFGYGFPSENTGI